MSDPAFINYVPNPPAPLEEPHPAGGDPLTFAEAIQDLIQLEPWQREMLAAGVTDPLQLSVPHSRAHLSRIANAMADLQAAMSRTREVFEGDFGQAIVELAAAAREDRRAMWAEYHRRRS